MAEFIKAQATGRLHHTLVSPHQIQSDVNALLTGYFEGKLAAAQTVGSSYFELWKAINLFVMAGGKRYRPYLAVLAYQACDGRNYDKILPVAVSQELFHISLLIHDDIIDRDFMRYGRANVSGVFLRKYRALTDEATATHYAAGAALLAGDLTLSAAHQWLALADFSDGRKQAAMQLFGKAMFEVAAGELLDTEAALSDPAEVDSLAIAGYKTASYTVVAPLCIGAVMAGASAATIETFHRLGEPLGIAYQLADDLLGLFGDETLTGKPVLSDLREGKRTYLMQQALKKTSGPDHTIIAGALGNPAINLDQLEAVRAVVENCGAKTQVEARIAALKHSSLTSLAQLPLPAEAANALRQFIDQALDQNT